MSGNPNGSWVKSTWNNGIWSHPVSSRKNINTAQKSLGKLFAGAFVREKNLQGNASGRHIQIDPSFPDIPPATPVGAGEGGGRAGKRGQRGEDWGFPPLPSASELHQDRTRDLRLATPPGLRMSITCCMCNGSVCCPALSAAFPSSAHSRSAWSWVPRRRMPVYLGSANTLCGQQSWHLLAGFLGAAKDWIMMTVESRHELGRFNRNPSHRGKGCASGLSREE